MGSAASGMGPKGLGRNSRVKARKVGFSGTIICHGYLRESTEPVGFGESGQSVTLDDLWFDGDTTGDKVRVSVVSS
jgi:hypothetical protein